MPVFKFMGIYNIFEVKFRSWRESSKVADLHGPASLQKRRFWQVSCHAPREDDKRRFVYIIGLNLVLKRLLIMGFVSPVVRF